MEKTEKVEKTVDLEYLVKELQLENAELKEKVAELEQTVEELKNKKGRKSEVLGILNEGNHVSIQEIAKRLGISTKNVSSQLTYLKTDGYAIYTDNNGKKFLAE